jgi:histidinol-phosphatase
VTELQDRLEAAVAIAREAAFHAVSYFQATDLAVDIKADESPVTKADKEAEELMRRRLDESCSADAIVGEEFGDTPGTSGYTWYLDPIDGTKAFIRGVPLFGTMLGLEHAGRAVAGVIVFPALGELVYGAEGLGSWWAVGAASATASIEVREAHVSYVTSMDQASVSLTGFNGFSDAGVTGALARLAGRPGMTRGWSDCYGHYLVATGRMDAMIDPVMSVWDCAPLQSIIEGAGGRFTDLTGVTTIHGESAISTNGLVHDDVLALVMGAY